MICTSTLVLFFLFLCCCHYTGVESVDNGNVSVLLAVGEKNIRETKLTQNPTTDVHTGAGLGILQSLEGNRMPQPHRRRMISGTNHEGILRGSHYIVSDKNGSFSNISIPCEGKELYDPVGLIIPSIRQLITCKEDSTVLVVVLFNAEYRVEEHFVSEFDDEASNVAIVTKDDDSTAVYVVEGYLMYASLDSSNEEVPLAALSSECQCDNWELLSYSDTHIALLCSSSKILCLASGIDGQTEKKLDGIANPDLLMTVRNKGIVVEVTDYGVKVHANDLVDFYQINMLPYSIEKVDYSIVNDVLFLILHATDNKHIFVLDSRVPYTKENVLVLVNESESSIANNTYYIFGSSLVYTVREYDSWATKVVQFGSFTNGQNHTVYQPSNPVLYDLVVSTASSQSTSVSPSGTTSTTTTHTTDRTTSTEGTTVSSSSAAPTQSTVSNSAHPNPTVPVQPLSTDYKTILAFVLPFFVLIVIFVLVIIAIFFLFRSSNTFKALWSPRNSPSPSPESPESSTLSQNSSTTSIPLNFSTQETINTPYQATDDGHFAQEQNIGLEERVP